MDITVPSIAIFGVVAASALKEPIAKLRTSRNAISLFRGFVLVLIGFFLSILLFLVDVQALSGAAPHHSDALIVYVKRPAKRRGKKTAKISSI